LLEQSIDFRKEVTLRKYNKIAFAKITVYRQRLGGEGLFTCCCCPWSQAIEERQDCQQPHGEQGPQK
jgi:hypothetical protein